MDLKGSPVTMVLLSLVTVGTDPLQSIFCNKDKEGCYPKSSSVRVHSSHKYLKVSSPSEQILKAFAFYKATLYSMLSVKCQLVCNNLVKNIQTKKSAFAY